jgi:purine-cytosine permease-like protein
VWHNPLLLLLGLHSSCFASPVMINFFFFLSSYVLIWFSVFHHHYYYTRKVISKYYEYEMAHVNSFFYIHVRRSSKGRRWLLLKDKNNYEKKSEIIGISYSI